MSITSPTPMAGSHLLLPLPFQPILLREYAEIRQQQFTKRFSHPPHHPLQPHPHHILITLLVCARLQSMKDRLNQTQAPLAKGHKQSSSSTLQT